LIEQDIDLLMIGVHRITEMLQLDGLVLILTGL
jgi:hypothetical protein